MVKEDWVKNEAELIGRVVDRHDVSQFVVALSPVNHKGIHQDSKQASVYLLLFIKQVIKHFT